jgi:hypothetical protein
MRPRLFLALPPLLAGWLGCNLVLGLQRGELVGGGGTSTAHGGGGTSTATTSTTGITSTSTTTSTGPCVPPDVGPPADCTTDPGWAKWSQKADAVLHDNGDGTVTDPLTRLMWEQATDPTKRSQAGAADYCRALTLAGHCDYRLPTRIELASLVAYAKNTAPQIDTAAFPGGLSFAYWTSSSGPFGAFWVNFANGLVDPNSNPLNLAFVRCVRAAAP